MVQLSQTTADSDWVRSYTDRTWLEIESLSDQIAAARRGAKNAETDWSHNYWVTVLSSLQTRWSMLTSHLDAGCDIKELQEPLYTIRHDWIGGGEYGSGIFTQLGSLIENCYEKLIKLVDRG